MPINANGSELELLAVARERGLEKAADEFPDDVIAAAQAAVFARNALPPVGNPAAEPWPPMRARPPS